MRNNTSEIITVDRLITIATSTEIVLAKNIKGIVKLGGIVADDEKDAHVSKIRIQGDVSAKHKREWFLPYEIFLARLGLIEDDPLDWMINKHIKNAVVTDSLSPSFAEGRALIDLEWDKYEELLQAMAVEFKTGLDSGEIKMISIFSLLE